MKTIADRMTRDVLFVRETDPIHTAVELVVEKRIRNLPVLAEMEQFVGLVTELDIQRAQPSPLFPRPQTVREIYEETPVSEIMQRDPVTIHPDAKIYDATRIMIEKRVNVLPVVEEGSLVGIFTEIDVMRYCIEVIANYGG